MNSTQLQNILDGLPLLLPEFLLLVLMVATLVLGIWSKKIPSLFFAGLAVVAYISVTIILLFHWPKTPTVLFGGMLRVDDFSHYFKILFSLGGLLTVLLPMQRSTQPFASGVAKTHEVSSEYYLLIHSTVLGAFLLAMSMNFVMMLLSLEMISLCSYALVGFKFTKESAEGSMKYFLFGTVATAVMIFGISLLVAQAGTLDFSSGAFVSGLIEHQNPLQLIAALLILAGLLFKITAVPFHLWAPDVYESSPTPVVAFFSTIPKLAGFSVLIKFTLAINLFGQSLYSWQIILAVISIATIVVGNFSALAQKDAKRMMAYSSIAQSGFMLIGLATLSLQGVHFLLFYGSVFLLANFIVFNCLQQFESKINGLSISSFAGWGPVMIFTSISLLIGFISLTGLPPTAGFSGKLFLFSGLWAFYQENEQPLFLWLLIIGLINTVVSLFFYFKIPFYLFIKRRPEADNIKSNSYTNLFNFILSLLLIYLFFQPGLLMNWISKISFIL